jgi:hypothetical protein
MGSIGFALVGVASGESGVASVVGGVYWLARPAVVLCALGVATGLLELLFASPPIAVVGAAAYRSADVVGAEATGVLVDVA